MPKHILYFLTVNTLAFAMNHQKQYDNSRKNISFSHNANYQETQQCVQ